MESPALDRRFAWQASVAAVLAAWLAGAALAAHTGGGPLGHAVPEALVAGQRAERAISGGDKQYFLIPLRAGDLIELEVEQLGADVGLTLRDPAGATLFEGNSPNAGHGIEPLRAIASVDGPHELEIWSLMPQAPEGRYTVHGSPPRPATEAERQRFTLRNQAWALTEGGMDLRMRARDAATLRQSIERLEAAAPLWAEVEDSDQQARALNAAGLSHRQLGESERARELYGRALDLWRRTGNRIGEADQLNNLGRLAATLGDLRGALETHQRALAIRREVADLRGVAESLAQIGATEQLLGEPDRASDALEEALAISRELGDRSAESHTRNNLGLVEQARNQPQAAIEQFTAALELFREADSARYQAVTLSNLGTVYLGIGDFHRARSLFAEALELNRRIGDRSGVAATQYNLGWTLAKAGEPEPALRAYREALEEFATVKDRRGQGRTLVAVGAAELDLERAETAIERLQEGLSLLEETGDLSGQFDAHHGLAKALDALGRPTEALAAIEAALAVSARMDNSGSRALALTEAARIRFGLGELESARGLLTEALTLTESIRSRVASQTHRTTYLARSLDRYELLTDVLMAQHANQPEGGHAAEALANVERARARSLLELLVETEIRADENPRLQAEEASLRGRLNVRERRRLELAARESEAAAAEASTLEAEVQRLLDRLVDVRARLRTENPRYAELIEPGTASVRELQEELLDADTLLLEYALGETTSYLWVLSRSELRAFRLPGRARIEELAQRVSRLLQAPAGDADADPAARARARARRHDEQATAMAQLSTVILGPIGDLLNRHRRLVVSADGALQSLPFAALPLPGSGGEAEYLVVSHEVIHTPSASVLLGLRRELAGRPRAAKALAVFADPVFRHDDPRVRTAVPSAVALTAESRQRGSAEPASPEPSAPGGGFHRLRFSRREAERLAAMVPEDQRLVALSFEASRETATSPEIADYRIVHFATHGVLNSARPELSGVVLSLVDEAGEAQPGFLRLHDIYNLRLGADLVVLSACQTALGQEVRGEGLVGLTRGFMYAGAPRVVASLWQVPDRASAILMERFYRAMLEDGLSAGAALRHAQLSMIEEGRFAEPFAWAAFILEGEWR